MGATTLLTVEQFLQLPEVAGDEHRRFELRSGELVEMGETTPWHNIVRGRFERILGDFTEEAALGMVLSESGVQIDSNNLYRPDLRFWDAPHWASVDLDTSPIQVIPQLVVEVASPSNKTSDLFEKVDAHLRAGVHTVWLVIRRPYEIHVFEASGGRRIVRAGEKLEGPALLPGFSEDASRFLPR